MEREKERAVAALSVLTGQIQQGLNLVAAKSQAFAGSFRGRGTMRKGAAEAAKRRKWVAQLDE